MQNLLDVSTIGAPIAISAVCPICLGIMGRQPTATLNGSLVHAGCYGRAMTFLRMLAVLKLRPDSE